jgi:RimJ/RimL family protein N-acetyltransferase
VKTERLILRHWRDEDLEAFARINANPLVMEHFPKLMTREESDAAAARIRAHFDEHGFGLWAVEREGSFIGYVGLMIPSFEAHFTPCVEVGWRLAHESWGHGYAIEAARAACRHGFGELGLAEIVSFTVPENLRSRRVMEKLGMSRNPDEDFNHPRLSGHRLERHVLYRLAAARMKP